MKRVPFVALALSLMATSALAQPRHFRDEGQSEAQPPRAEQPRQRPERPQPQAQPQAAPPQAQVQHNQGRGPREDQPAARQAVVPQAQPERVDRREFGGRRSDGPQPQVVQPQAQPQPYTPDRRSFGGRRGDGQVAQPQQTVPQAGQRQWQGDPRQRGDRPQAQPQAPATNGQWDGRRDGRDGRDGARDGRSGDRDGRNWNSDGRQGTRDGSRDGRSGGADRNAWTRDPNGWNRDGGRGGWDRDHHGPQVRPDWARRDGRYDRDRNRPRYDERRYPHFFSFQQRFRLPYYAAPFGYYDYEWGYGDYLPWGWYGPNYWLENWWDFGLPPPPIGCEWVRVGRDAVLIDTFDGRVLSVARLLFW